MFGPLHVVNEKNLVTMKSLAISVVFLCILTDGMSQSFDISRSIDITSRSIDRSNQGNKNGSQGNNVGNQGNRSEGVDRSVDRSIQLGGRGSSGGRDINSANKAQNTQNKSTPNLKKAVTKISAKGFNEIRNHI